VILFGSLLLPVVGGIIFTLVYLVSIGLIVRMIAHSLYW
jgi:hypothetical protein